MSPRRQASAALLLVAALLMLGVVAYAAAGRDPATEALKRSKAEKDLIVKLSDYPDCAPDTRHARLFTPFI
jgi:hypothetical protein